MSNHKHTTNMKLASIEEICSVRPHINADRLDIAKVLGWQCIVKRGEFREGDKVVFVVIDTVLPDSPWSEFLKDGDKPIRLKTIKLRGEYSQGLVLPLDVLPEHMRSWQVGADVGGELGITKYEKEVPVQLAGIVKATFPSYLVSPTDEDNGLSNLELVSRVVNSPEVTVTGKLDGSSMTVIIKRGVIENVCSRRMDLLETQENGFWKAARKLNTDIATGIDELVIQGELMGPGVQGNQLKLCGPEVFVYQIRKDSKWLNYKEMSELCGSMDAKTVPLIAEISDEDEDMKSDPLGFFQRMANGLKLDDGSPMEGIVVRPSSYVASGIGRPLGFKIINQNYKD